MNREQPFEHTHFVEEVGLMFELIGLPRMAGRIFGWLLISQPPHQSSGELAEVLQASKGSISSMTRLLIQLGLIERLPLPGDRRDFFQIKPHAWSQLHEQQLARIAAFRKLSERGLDLLKNQSPESQQRLREMYDYHAFWEQELPRVHQRWLEHRREMALES